MYSCLRTEDKRLRFLDNHLGTHHPNSHCGFSRAGTDHAKMRSVGKRGHVEREKTPATTVYDDGSIANDDRRSQFLGDDDDARTNVSRGRSERSMASSVARSHVRGGSEGGSLIVDKTGSGGALEAVQEESRLQTAVSERTRREMSGALHLSDLENALAADAVEKEEEDEFAVDWDDVMEELLPLVQEAVESEEPEIRRNAVMALRKCVTIGDLQAMPLIRRAMEDSDWMCREAAMLALRELVVPGDVEATEIVCTMLQDARREVRTAALKALETVARPGDPEFVSKLITIKEYSRKWAEITKRPGWEIREAGCLAIGVVADLDCQEGIASLKKSLTDERIDVQRAATYAMGQVAERVVPEDMVWTYNNMTAQPAVKSSWQNLRWNVLRQAYVPNGYKMPMDPQIKHSPRECIQALTKTPRGGAIPHLLLTPRQEHLYEEDQIQEVLKLREEKRKDGEKRKIVLEIADKIKAAIERHDIEEVERLQEQLKQFEETEASESDDEQSMQRSTRTKSLASFEDGSDVGSEDTRSQVSFESFNDAKSAVSFSRSAVSFGVTRSRVI